MAMDPLVFAIELQLPSNIFWAQLRIIELYMIAIPGQKPKLSAVRKVVSSSQESGNNRGLAGWNKKFCVRIRYE